MLTEIGPVGIEVPQTRDGSFEAESCPDGNGGGTAPIRSCSRSLPGLTTGEIAAHFEEVYGARVSKDTISRITEKAAGELTGWFARPLDPHLAGVLH